MDRFLEILREELEKMLAIGGSYANKNSMMQTFDKASVKAIVRYAKEKEINLE